MSPSLREMAGRQASTLSASLMSGRLFADHLGEWPMDDFGAGTDQLLGEFTYGELGRVAEIDGTNDIRASFHHGHYSAN